MSVLDKVRQWIDGENAEGVLEEAARDAQVKPRSQSEEFIVKIAKAVEEVMQRELVPLPQGTAIIPTEYIIFLSDADDKDWQGIKRRGLEQGLYHILSERAKELAGKRKLETQAFSVELRVDGTLETGEVRVQHSWDDSSSNKTGILPRAKSPAQTPPANNYVSPPSNLKTTQPAVTDQTGAGSQNFPPPPTFQHSAASQVSPIQTGDSEELTHVQRRPNKELYKLEIWRDGVRQSVVPVYQNEVSIGRGSKSQPVDITLAGDAEISRRHLTLFADGQNNFWVVNEGRNPAMINNNELATKQRISIAPGVPLSVCSYLLRIQPK